MSFVSVRQEEYDALVSLYLTARGAVEDMSISALVELEIAVDEVQRARNEDATAPRDTLPCIPLDDEQEARMVSDAAEILRGVAVR